MLGLSTQPTLLRRAGFDLLQNGGGAALAQGEFGFVFHIGERLPENPSVLVSAWQRVLVVQIAFGV